MTHNSTKFVLYSSSIIK